MTVRRMTCSARLCVSRIQTPATAAIMPEMSSSFRSRPTRSPVRYEAICSMPERIITAPKP